MKQPRAVLFACTQNVIRSPMAAAILHHYFGSKIYVASCGIAAGDPDPFVAMVMDEIGLDLKTHRPHSFEDLEDSAFDLLITLSPEAESKAKDMARVLEATQTAERDVPEYVSVDHKDMKGTYVRGPKLADVPYPVQMEPSLVVEYYSR